MLTNFHFYFSSRLPRSDLGVNFHSGTKIRASPSAMSVVRRRVDPEMWRQQLGGKCRKLFTVYVVSTHSERNFHYFREFNFIRFQVIIAIQFQRKRTSYFCLYLYFKRLIKNVLLSFVDPQSQTETHDIWDFSLSTGTNRTALKANLLFHTKLM